MTRETQLRHYLKERNIPLESPEAYSIIEGIEWADKHPALMQKAIDEAKYKKLRALAYNMYTSAQYLSTDASILRKAMAAFHRFIIEENKDEKNKYNKKNTFC